MTKEDEAAEAAGEAMERALMKATRAVEQELLRVVKTGEDSIDRLALRIAEVLASAAIDSVLGAASSGSQGEAQACGFSGSVNQVASAVTRAARRGVRFT
jgi:hypothetical protein